MASRIGTWLGTALAIAALPALAQEHAHAAPPALAVGVALDGAGRLWLARVGDGLLSGRLVVSRSDDGGASFTAPVAVTPQPEAVTADSENRPKIAVGADGIVHLSWTQNLGQKMTGHIRYARSVDGGQTFSAPAILNDDRQLVSHRFDSLAIDGQGGVAAVWLDARGRTGKSVKGSPATDVGIFAAVSTDGGASFGRNRRIADHSCQCCRTGLTWTTNGPVAFWRHVFGKNIRDFAIADLNGGPVRRVTDDEWEIDGCPHHGGGIATDGRGNLHIVWFTNGKNRQGIFYRRIARTDFGMGAPMPLGDPARQAGHPDVAAVGSRVLVSWREFDGKRLSAWAMISEDAGASWGAPQRLAETTQAADYALPLIDGRQALVVWNTQAEGLRVLPVGARP
ncbi:MAG: sialidase family protein [Rhodocyclaceae bacterium]|nr:sialidase family protein [Rhodocyclaceae bacterium]